MMRYLIAAALAMTTILAAPSALAQDGEPQSNETPSDQAWVDDCPPDMMCAYQAPEEEQPAKDNASADEPTYSGDCGGEVCAYDGGEPGQPYGDEDCIECSGPSDGGAEPGQSMGPEDCIDCMQPPRDGSSSSCMDGQQEGETCDDDKQYFGGEPSRGPADGSCENCRGDAGGEPVEAAPISAPAEGAEGDGGVTSVQDDEQKENPVPAPAVALGILAVAAVAILAGTRRVR